MQKRYRELLAIILVATHQNSWGIDLQPNDIVAPLQDELRLLFRISIVRTIISMSMGLLLVAHLI